MAADRLRRLPVALLAAGLLAACEPIPEPGAGAALGHAPAAARHQTPEELVLLLPEEAAGFVRGHTVPLPLGHGGRETGYRTRGRLGAGATVQFYRPLAGPLPDAPDSPEVAAAFEELLQDALRPAPHRKVQEGERLTLPGGLRCAETTGLYGRERIEGMVCAAGVGGMAVRLRITMPARGDVAGDPRAFASGILAALRGG